LRSSHQWTSTTISGVRVPDVRLSLSVAILLCGVVAALHADYRDAFRRGVQAARRNQWSEVVSAMREARKEEPRDTGERINISGMEFVPYVPNYYLGLALFNLKDCVGAVQAWQALEGQGGMARVSGGERGAVAKFRKVCETRIAAVAKPAPPEKPPAPVAKPIVPEKAAGPDPAALADAVQNANAAIARAQDAERAVTQLASDELLSRVWRAEAPLGAADERARDTLARARTELEAGRRESNLQRVQEAATLAGVANKEFTAVRQAGEDRRTQLANEAAAAAAAAAKPEPPPAKPTPTAPAAPPKVQPFTPPPPLAAAARLFFNAQYAEAAASLSKQRYSDAPAAGHAALLRAASTYALYLVGGEKDETLLGQARDAVREARRVAPALQPDPRAFSPRFVEFYRRTR
jgi:hypothetical protein